MGFDISKEAGAKEITCLLFVMRLFTRVHNVIKS